MSAAAPATAVLSETARELARQRVAARLAATAQQEGVGDTAQGAARRRVSATVEAEASRLLAARRASAAAAGAEAAPQASLVVTAGRGSVSPGHRSLSRALSPPPVSADAATFRIEWEQHLQQRSIVDRFPVSETPPARCLSARSSCTEERPAEVPTAGEALDGAAPSPCHSPPPRPQSPPPAARRASFSTGGRPYAGGAGAPSELLGRLAEAAARGQALVAEADAVLCRARHKG
eukprot:TRINITY_DN19769_c0_g1_i1.p1 TRINITY_DN19769_c0_g1~~TRINITY_DN19769_c0_g1_i1.p1  ORF type:complete len:235 (+),score=34.84 TRINITY_DN19769_c0_g1_i1:80-784(+)